MAARPVGPRKANDVATIEAPAPAAASAPRTRPLPPRWVVLTVMAALLLIASAASLAFGSRSIPLPEVWDALTGTSGTMNTDVVRELRIPRTILGIAVGLALGAAGALMQGHTRNPLAEPGLLGVSAGAEVAVVMLVFFAGAGSVAGISAASMVGAVIATLLVLVLGALAGRGYAALSPVPLALAGFAMAAAFQAVSGGLILLNLEAMYEYRVWAAGSLAGRDGAVVTGVLPIIAIGLLLAMMNTPSLNALSLGDETARGLGHRIGRSRTQGVAAITLLTGGAVAAAGPIVFLGLAAPHGARTLVGPDYRWLVPISALFGAVILLAADIIGRFMAAPGEVPVGIVMAIIGAPVLIVLVRRSRLALG